MAEHEVDVLVVGGGSPASTWSGTDETAETARLEAPDIAPL